MKTIIFAAGLIGLALAEAPAPSLPPCPLSQSAISGPSANFVDLRWRRCRRDRWVRMRCQWCWRDRWGRVRCN